MNLSQVWNWLREKPTKPEMIANDTMVVMKVPITPTIRRNHRTSHMPESRQAYEDTLRKNYERRKPVAVKHGTIVRGKTVEWDKHGKLAKRKVHCHYCKKPGHYQPTCPLARKRVKRALRR